MHFWSIYIGNYFTVHLRWSYFLHFLILLRAPSQINVGARLLSAGLYPISFLSQSYPLGIFFQHWLEQHHLMHLDNIVKRFFKNEIWNDNHSACSDHKTHSHFQKFWCKGAREGLGPLTKEGLCFSSLCCRWRRAHKQGAINSVCKFSNSARIQ